MKYKKKGIMSESQHKKRLGLFVRLENKRSLKTNGERGTSRKSDQDVWYVWSQKKELE